MGERVLKIQDCVYCHVVLERDAPVMKEKFILTTAFIAHRSLFFTMNAIHNIDFFGQFYMQCIIMHFCYCNFSTFC